MPTPTPLLVPVTIATLPSSTPMVTAPCRSIAAAEKDCQEKKLPCVIIIGQERKGISTMSQEPLGSPGAAVQSRGVGDRTRRTVGHPRRGGRPPETLNWWASGLHSESKDGKGRRHDCPYRSLGRRCDPATTRPSWPATRTASFTPGPCDQPAPREAITDFCRILESGKEHRHHLGSGPGLSTRFH